MDTYLAWVAGFFDGEGCIQISMPGPRGGFHTLHVSLSQKRSTELFKVKEVFGGSIREGHKRTSGVTEWSITGKRAYDFLKLIHPHLRIKKQEADIGMEFFEVKTLHLSEGRGHKLPQDEWNKREKYRQLLKALKH